MNGISMLDGEKAGRRKFKMAVAVLCLTLTGLIGSLATAEDAEAATGVSYCFKQSNGAAWTYGVLLQVKSSGQWHSIAARDTHYDGCGSFSNPYAYLPSRVVALHALYGYGGVVRTFWWGLTREAPAGVGSFHLGTNTVWCYLSCMMP
jgi:hypothetical protein